MKDAAALERRLLRATARAVADFRLVEEGDRILVAVSGGKDSLTLLHLLQRLRERAPVAFDLVAVNLDQGQPGFPADVLRAHLDADTAYFYQAPQRADLIGVSVVFYSPEGRRTSSLTSQTGTYDWRSGNMEARGNVVAVTPDHRKLTTSVLRYDRRSDKISGPNDFVFDAPDRHLEGESFTSDPEFKNVVTTRPRRGVVREGERRP